MKLAARLLATFFGVGLFPFVPGTAASAVAALGYGLALHRLPVAPYAILVGALFFVGAWSSAVHAAELRAADPGRIVVDEVCGQLVALAFLPPDWTAVAAAFVLFRVFDIIKPWPIRKLERLPGGWGIMADDIGAGLAAAALGRLVLLWL